jgi:hypothetical protein
MSRSRIAEWSYQLGCLSAVAAIIYRLLWFVSGLGPRLFGRIHVLPFNLLHLSFLLLVISIASNALALVQRDGGKVA